MLSLSIQYSRCANTTEPLELKEIHVRKPKCLLASSMATWFVLTVMLYINSYSGLKHFLQPNARTVGLLAIAKENNLDVELVETQPSNVSNDYRKLNKLGKIPTFEGSDGYILTEVIAIAVYCTWSYFFLSPLIRPVPGGVDEISYYQTVIPGRIDNVDFSKI